MGLVCGGVIRHDFEQGDGGDVLHDAVRWAAERTQVNAILHVVLFQLGQNVLPIGVLAQSGNVRPNLKEDKRSAS